MTATAADWHAECASIPPGYTIPDQYSVEDDGVYQVRETREGEQRTRVTYAPLIPITVYVDPDGLQLVELAWRDGARWVTRVVPRATAKSGRKLIAALGDAGLPAVDADSRTVERWLAAAEATNREKIPRRDLARQLGWQSDGTFVSTNAPERKVEPKYEEQLAALAAHHPCGSLEAWTRGLKPLESLPVARIPIYAAFASVLLDLCNVDSFTTDISGRSTRGKTTAAKAGLSVWADPSEQADGLFSWRTTMIAAEKRLNLVRGLPVVIDETRVAKSPELVDQVLYQVPKNVGQARGGGWPSLLRWRCIVISTGEQSALSFTTHQGAAARVLAVQRPPFGIGTHDNGQAAIDVGRSCEQNYGLAGPAFVEQLQALIGDPGARAKVIQRHQALTEACGGKSDMSERRAPMVALLALAAELAHEFELVPFPSPDLTTWLDLFATDDPTDNRAEMAADVVREFIAANGEALWVPGHPNRSHPPGGWIGRRIRIGDADTVALLPEKLRVALEKAGYALPAVLPGWDESGILRKAKKGRTPLLYTRQMGEDKVRMYIFDPKVFKIDAEDGDAE